MSYILDALRKSESERRQGRVPDLGHQVQFVHKPKKKKLSAGAWIAIGLGLNALVIGLALWLWLPDSPVPDPEQASRPVESGLVERQQTEPVEAPEDTGPEDAPVETAGRDAPDPAADSGTIEPEQQMPVIIRPGQQAPAPLSSNEPTLIVPGQPARSVSSGENGSAGMELPARVPHLVELPLSFQKSIPDLTFNSHVYSTQPSSSRVMINGNYLRSGQSFSGVRVEKITEDGVVLSKDGRAFRVGIVRDWVSPR